jgi:hypothetical protein
MRKLDHRFIVYAVDNGIRAAVVTLVAQVPYQGRRSRSRHAATTGCRRDGTCGGGSGKVTESARCLPVKGRWINEGNVRRSDQDRTEKGNMEMRNEYVAWENMCSTKRQKNCGRDCRGKSPPNGHRVERERALHSKMVQI